jgi:hypothetical protein
VSPGQAGTVQSHPDALVTHYPLDRRQIHPGRDQMTDAGVQRA